MGIVTGAASVGDMTTSTAADTDRSRWLALYVLCGSMLMIVLDATIVNVALPAIRTDLRFTPSSLASVVNAYLTRPAARAACAGCRLRSQPAGRDCRVRCLPGGTAVPAGAITAPDDCDGLDEARRIGYWHGEAFCVLGLAATRRAWTLRGGPTSQ